MPFNLNPSYEKSFSGNIAVNIFAEYWKCTTIKIAISSYVCLGSMNRATISFVFLQHL